MIKKKLYCMLLPAFTLGLFLSRCGGTQLAGDPSESRPETAVEDAAVEDVCEEDHEAEEETPAVCGNGIVEAGEECEGGSRPCNEQGCGGGVQACTPGCAWGECIEDRMAVLAGPKIVSDSFIVDGNRQAIAWTGSSFLLFYACKEGDEGKYELCMTTLDENGETLAGPSVITPASLFVDEREFIYEFAVAPSPREMDYAFLFLVHGTIGTTRMILNFGNEAGEWAMDRGILLWEENHEGIYFNSRFDGMALSFFIYPDEYGVAFLNTDGETIASHRPTYCNTFNKCVRGIVPDNEGYTVFFEDRGNPGDWEREFRMRSFGESGSLLTDDTVLVEMQRLDGQTFSAVFTGSRYGVVYGILYPDTPPYFADLNFMAVERGGDVAVPAVAIGTIYGSLFGAAWDAEIAWTGSEYGVAFAAPMSDDTELDVKTSVRLARLDEEGNLIGDVLEIDREHQSHSPRVIWDGSRYGVSWNEPHYPRFEGSLHFAILGCATP